MELQLRRIDTARTIPVGDGKLAPPALPPPSICTLRSRLVRAHMACAAVGLKRRVVHWIARGANAGCAGRIRSIQVVSGYAAVGSAVCTLLSGVVFSKAPDARLRPFAADAVVANAFICGASLLSLASGHAAGRLIVWAQQTAPRVAAAHEQASTLVASEAAALAAVDRSGPRPEMPQEVVVDIGSDPPTT